MARPKVALYWGAGCGGCEQSVLDLGEALPQRLQQLDVVFWPLVCDAKREILNRLEDGELAASLMSGALRTAADVEMARLLRRKSRCLVALGSCAQLGGVVGLGNLRSRTELLARAYGEMETLAPAPAGERQIGSGVGATPLLSRAGPLRDVVTVDGVLPGCPPLPAAVDALLAALAADRLPRCGEVVLAEEQALCRSCPRSATLPQAPTLEELRRPADTLWDAARCFLAQGLVCMGPATRGGCGGRCIVGNYPCRGCFGPVLDAADPGARMLALLATYWRGGAEEGAAEALPPLPDPLGMFYRYTLASSWLPGCGRPVSDDDP